MTTTETLYAISGEKVETLLMTDEGLLFMGKKVSEPEEFRAAWDKKLNLVNKTTVRYDAIKSIRKEQDSDTIVVSYKATAGLPGEVKFTFSNDDPETFFETLVRNHYFVREEGQTTPLGAASGSFIGFVLMAVATYYFVGVARGLADGTATHSRRGRARLMEGLLEFLGPTGTLLVSGGIAAYLLYKAIRRYRNPPMQTELKPRTS